MEQNLSSDQQLNPKAFLDALFRNCDSNLWLELRCIHPVTAHVCTLWTKPQHPETALTQAQRLNTEGYGIYFAPCLRSEKKGNAASAALLPALWIDIDCDGNEQQSAKSLAKLKAFDPPPSGIIASGSGWHGYWLLEHPYKLETEGHKARASSLLEGLFKALDGDNAYVKSVASVMRLPGTINTKPERDNASVQVIDFYPERRYALKAFDWLILEPQLHGGNSSAVAVIGNGNHDAIVMLPKRTETYLTFGAANGNRNQELFAAACQIRDAGYSLIDAERQLIPRHIADGNGSESSSTREKEAKATIQSAFSQPPREPIQSLAAKAHELVTQLVGSHKVEHQSQLPKSGDISMAVEACAYLNAVEWAEERKRLKALCGDGLRLVDLDRLYREARRNLERQSLPTEDRYLFADGCIVYERVTERGLNRQKVADWTAQILERSSRIDDDGQVEHLVKLKLNGHGKTQSLLVPSELFGDSNALQRHITRQAGERFTARTSMNKHLPTALLNLSGNYPTRMMYRFMGWTQLDDHWAYVTPGLTVSADGIHDHSPEVELESRLRDYGLRNAEWTQAIAAFQALKEALPTDIAPALIAYTFLPLVQRFFPAAAPKPALHLQGTTGTGKSEIASLLCSFYGRFQRDMPPSQWGDTVNTVEMLGYSLADALYWVDDYKTIYADERTFTRFLQSYSRTMGRGRLTREAKLRQERPCRGHILSTGETTLEGEASILARMIVLKVSPWSDRDPTGKALAEADRLREHLAGFTAQFAPWIARQADSGELTTKLSKDFANSNEGYRDRLNSSGLQPASIGRLVQNWAVLVTTYRLIRTFLAERDSDHVLPGWCDTILESARAMRGERAGLLFIDALQQLLASGELMLATDLQKPEEARPGTTIVGYKDGQKALILPDVAYRAVVRIHPLKFNTSAIGAQLQEDGWLIPGADSLTVQRRVRGVPTRFWQLKTDFI